GANMELWAQIEQAQQRLRERVFRVGTAAQWHIAKTRTIIANPELIERYIAEFDGEDQRVEYQQSLPGLITQVKRQDTGCAKAWASRPAGLLGSLLTYYQQRDRLADLLLRFRFPLRAYERLVRQPGKPMLEQARQLLSQPSGSAGAVGQLETRLRL